MLLVLRYPVTNWNSVINTSNTQLLLCISVIFEDCAISLSAFTALVKIKIAKLKYKVKVAFAMELTRFVAKDGVIPQLEATGGYDANGSSGRMSRRRHQRHVSRYAAHHGGHYGAYAYHHQQHHTKKPDWRGDDLGDQCVTAINVIKRFYVSSLSLPLRTPMHGKKRSGGCETCFSQNAFFIQ